MRTGMPAPLILKSSIGGSSPCGELVLALAAGMTVWIHLLGLGWGHHATSLGHGGLLQGLQFL